MMSQYAYGAEETSQHLELNSQKVKRERESHNSVFKLHSPNKHVQLSNGTM